MFRSKINYLLVVLIATVCVSSTVVFAKNRDAGTTDSISSTLDVLTPVTVGGTSVQPGMYTVKADGSTVTFMMNGKEVAHASVQWKDSAQKAKSTNMLADSGAVKEIHFGGKTRYIEIAN
jgi:hypothetical protein